MSTEPPLNSNSGRDNPVRESEGGTMAQADYQH
jgi:hypothetical protein